MPSRRRHGWNWLAAGALFLAGSASAQQAPRARPANEDAAPAELASVALDWLAPPECPARASVLREVLRLVGPGARGVSRGPVKARAVISRTDDARFRVVITTFDEEAGERAMFAPSCHALADAIALVIALRIDPTLLDRPPAPLAPTRAASAEVPLSAQLAPAEATAATEATKATGASPNPPALPAPANLVASRAPPRPTPEPAPAAPRDQLALGASLASSVGDLPFLSAGGEAIAGWLHARFRIELRGATALVQRADVQGRSGVGGAVRIASGGLRGCYGLLGAGMGGRERPPFGVAACVEGELDWMWVAGYGANPLDANAGWVALGGGLLAEWNLGRGVALRASLDALAPLARPSFVIDDAAGGTALVHRPGIAFGRAGLGVEMHFF